MFLLLSASPFLQQISTASSPTTRSMFSCLFRFFLKRLSFSYSAVFTVLWAQDNKKHSLCSKTGQKSSSELREAWKGHVPTVVI